MAGVESGVSMGTAVAAAPSMGSFRGGEMGSSFAAPGVLAQANFVAEQAWSASAISSPLDSAQAAMHSIAREAWAATEPMSVTEPSVRVLSPEVTAMLAFTGLQAQMSLAEPLQNLASTPAMETVPTNLVTNEITQTALDKSEPYSVIQEANSVVEEAVANSAIHVMSPFEVIGLVSVGAKAQEALSKESPVENAVQTVVQEVASVTDVIPESSDQAIAQRVAELAEELGLNSLEEQAMDIATQQVVSTQDSEEDLMMQEAVSEVEATVDVASQEEEVQGLLTLQREEIRAQEKEEDVDPALLTKEQPGPVRDEKAMGRRREIAADIISQMAKDSDALSSEKVANAFGRRVEEDPNAKSEVVRADGREDGTFGYITNDVRRTSFATNDEAVRIVDQAISSHPAVAIGPRPNLSQEALNKVLQGNSSRRYASLAA